MGRYQEDSKELLELIGGKRSVICIIAMGGDQDGIQCDRISDLYHYRRMLESLSIEAQLHHVAWPQVFESAGFSDWSDRKCTADHEVPKIRHACPGRCLLVRVDVIPAESRREIHDATACKNALRREIRTVSAQLLVIIEARVPPIRPLMGIAYSGCTVVVLQKTHALPSSHQSMQ